MKLSTFKVSAIALGLGLAIAACSSNNSQKKAVTGAGAAPGTTRTDNKGKTVEKPGIPATVRQNPSDIDSAPKDGYVRSHIDWGVYAGNLEQFLRSQNIVITNLVVERVKYTFPDSSSITLVEFSNGTETDGSKPMDESSVFLRVDFKASAITQDGFVLEASLDDVNEIAIGTFQEASDLVGGAKFRINDLCTDLNNGGGSALYADRCDIVTMDAGAMDVYVYPAN